MSVKRIVDTSFWTDDKVVNDFSVEDKYFMLYLMTNPHTTQLGIYSLNKKYMAFELGYSREVVDVLLDRFENKYRMIKYSNETGEIALKNSLKYSIVSGGKPVADLLNKEINQVKDKSLINFVFNGLTNSGNLNKTVQTIIDNYKENLVSKESIENVNDNDNDNDNDNEVSYHDTHHDTQLLDEIESEFETIWKIYKKKTDKTKSLKAYKKARKGYKLSDGTKYEPVDYETILNGVKNYNEYLEKNKTDTQYIKMFSTWLNGRCWENNYNVEKSSNGWSFMDL